MIEIIIILLALIDSYSEVLRLIETQRWGYWVAWVPSWGMNWGNKWYKIFDSFHLLPGLFKNGLLVLFLLNIPKDSIFGLTALLPEWLTPFLYIWLFWWIRNIGMHIIWVRKEYRPKYILKLGRIKLEIWKYLLPIVF